MSLILPNRCVTAGHTRLWDVVGAFTWNRSHVCTDNEFNIKIKTVTFHFRLLSLSPIECVSANLLVTCIVFQFTCQLGDWNVCHAVVRGSVRFSLGQVTWHDVKRIDFTFMPPMHRYVVYRYVLYRVIQSSYTILMEVIGEIIWSRKYEVFTNSPSFPFTSFQRWCRYDYYHY
jgi:hypothetical protein